MDYIQFLKGLHVQPDELTGKVWIRPEVARAIASELEANHRDIDAIKAERDAANQLIEASFVKLGWTIPDTPNHETITAVYDSLKAHVQAKYAQYKADAPAPTPPPADTGAGDAALRKLDTQMIGDAIHQARYTIQAMQEDAAEDNYAAAFEHLAVVLVNHNLALDLMQKGETR
jgi:glutamyl-tRNA reductase